MSRYIPFSTRSDFYRISIDRIVFIAADKNYTSIQLSNGKTIVFTLSLQKMQSYIVDILGDDARIFVRVGKSYIVNLSYIYHIDHNKRKLVLYADKESAEFTLSMSAESLRLLHDLMARK